MIVEFFITFRETLEAALIIGIILAYLAKTKKQRYNNIVYIGIGAGLVMSIIAAILFVKIAGGFEGTAEQLFEGFTMILGAVLLTTMIIWMKRRKLVKNSIEKKITVEIEKKDRRGLFLLVFVSVLREGIETVIFLGAASFAADGFHILGGLLGIISAILVGYLMFVVTLNLNVKRFINVSSMILLLFAAGLVAHGVHELQEAEIVPIIQENLWDINPPAPLEGQGIYPPLHEKGSIGSIAAGLFGYNGNPSLIEVIAYFAYILIVAIAFFRQPLTI